MVAMRHIPVLAVLAMLAMPALAQGQGFVYVADRSFPDSFIWQYSYDAAGTLTPLSPASVTAPDDAYRLALSPDGKHLYSVSATTSAILQYSVGGDGTLTPKSPASVTGHSGGHGAVVVSPDGSSLYAGGYLDGGSIYQYDIGAGGRLTPKDPPSVASVEGAVSVVIRPDGESLYLVPDGGSDSIQQYDIDTTDGTLSPKDPVDAGTDAVFNEAMISPDGDDLYATAGASVYQFSIVGDGELTLADQTSTSDLTWGLTVTHDGLNMFVVTTGGGDVIDQFTRSNLTGELTLQADATPPAPPSPGSFLALTPDSGQLYVSRGGDLWGFDNTAGLLEPQAGASAGTGPAVEGGIAVSADPAAGSPTFTATPGTTGSSTTFDAAGTTPRVGSAAIDSYNWDFGDGTPTLFDGGPTPGHTYSAPGTYVVTMTAVSTGADQNVSNGQAVLSAGPQARARRTIVVTDPPPDPPPGGDPPGDDPPPPFTADPPTTFQQPPPPQGTAPEFGEQVQAEPVQGRVLVKVPGTNRFVPLEDLGTIPVGSTVDATKGRVEIVVESGDGGAIERGVFYGGIFVVTQPQSGGSAVTDLKLTGGSFRGCPAVPARRRARAAARRRKRTSTVRKLWGDAQGSFRTTGKHSSATVRGTLWLVADRCDGTFTRVRRGRVDVRDFARRRTVSVRAGKTYLARPR